MKVVLLLFILVSVVSLITGLVMVIAFSNIYVIPYLESKDFITTKCYVTSLEMVPTSGNTVNISVCQEDHSQNNWDNLTITNLSSNTCVHVNAIIRVPGRQKRQGPLYANINNYDQRTNLGKVSGLILMSYVIQSNLTRYWY